MSPSLLWEGSAWDCLCFIPSRGKQKWEGGWKIMACAQCSFPQRMEEQYLRSS